MTGPDAEDTTVLITRLFDAPPGRVFDAWLIREEWEAWIGPAGMKCDVPMVDARVGGHYRITMRLSASQTVPVGGIFMAIDRPRTLVFTFGREGDPSGHTLITLTFERRGDSTELTLRQAGHSSVASRDDHTKGWNITLDKLVEHLAAAGSAA